jgi:hypothetical protein
MDDAIIWLSHEGRDRHTTALMRRETRRQLL